MLISSYNEGKGPMKTKKLMILAKGTIPEGYNNYFNKGTLDSPIGTFPWLETIVYTPNQGTTRERYFNHIIYKGKKAEFWSEINTYPFILSFMDRVFSIFRKKGYGFNPSEMDIKVVIPAPTK